MLVYVGRGGGVETAAVDVEGTFVLEELGENAFLCLAFIRVLKLPERMPDAGYWCERVRDCQASSPSSSRARIWMTNLYGCLIAL